jgi:hypothetical protein
MAAQDSCFPALVSNTCCSIKYVESFMVQALDGNVKTNCPIVSRTIKKRNFINLFQEPFSIKHFAPVLIYVP